MVIALNLDDKYRSKRLQKRTSAAADEPSDTKKEKEKMKEEEDKE
jgi:hypothetical protein